MRNISNRCHWIFGLCVALTCTAATRASAQGIGRFSALPTGVHALLPSSVPRPLNHVTDDAALTSARGAPRDSLTNGAVMGVIVGAAAFGGFAATLCHAYREEGGASCVSDTLRFAAIGGGIGIGAGLAIDAARSNHGFKVSLLVKF